MLFGRTISSQLCVAVLLLGAGNYAIASEEPENGQFTAGAEQLVSLLTGTADKPRHKKTQVEQEKVANDDQEVISEAQLDELLKLPLKEQQALIKQLLENSSNPLGLIRTLVKEGVLDLSPDEIRFIRNMTELRVQAENKPLQTPDVRSGSVSFDSRNRYKMYEFNVHDSGVTVLEFYDANGNPWPIVHHTPVKDYVLNEGYQSNTLTIQSETPYKVAFSHIRLEGFPNPISIKINYSTEVRDDIRTFRIPFVFKVDKTGETPQATYTPLTAVKAGDALDQSGNQIPDLEYEDLMYLASVGQFDEDRPVGQYAAPVLVDKPEIASVWRYGTKFVIRSRFQLMSNQYDVYVPSPEGVIVYVTDQLDTVITFNVNGRTQQVLLPDYHLY